MANLEIVSLETGTPQLRAPATGDAYLAPRTLNITPEANTSALTASSFSLTGSNAQSLLDLAGTWDTTGTPTALKLNVTDTASNAASLLMDLQVGGTSRFNIDKNGFITANASGSGFSIASTIRVSSAGGAATFWNGGALQWSSTASPAGSADLILARDAADTLAQRRTTNAQTFRIYNTYTDASNYERGFLRWNANVLEIGAEAGGTGSARALSLNAGAVLAGTSNTAGPNLTVKGGQGTGTGAGGSIVFQVAPAGSSGTAQNALADALKIESNKRATFSEWVLATRFLNTPVSTQGIVFDAGLTYLDSGSGTVFRRTSDFASAIFVIDAAHTLAQRNAANAQTFRVYGTFTDASNYVRASMASTDTAVTLAAETAGTGADDITLNLTAAGTGTVKANSNLELADAKNVVLNTTTGTKIGTGTTQKLAFWNATPVVQPTTGITAGTFVANTSGITDDSATFDGYTIGQVVAALRQIGALA